ncbi:uncharacterized protein [Salvelinus alpinus]|uniref:uncharacterized protein n=1 Tax=Salvelinus alpinus TaxID=8036 RepID=UPI0039FC9299
MERIYIPALVLYGFYLTHVVSVSPPHLVVVHSGENVTLQCINVLKKMGHVGWFKQVNSSEPLCITSMWSSLPTVHHQNGFQGNHMKMLITNRTTFLEITEVDEADSGLYFCGTLDNFFIFTNATVLKVQGHKDDKNPTEHYDKGEEDGTMKLFLLVVILGVVTAVLLIIILILVLKVRRDANRLNTVRFVCQVNQRFSLSSWFSQSLFFLILLVLTLACPDSEPACLTTLPAPDLEPACHPVPF